MAPPTINLEPYYESIKSWIEEKVPRHEILSRLEQEGMRMSIDTLKRAIRSWQLRYDREPDYQDSQALRDRVSFYFHHVQLTDAEMVTSLKKEGFIIGYSRLKRLRLEMELPKSVPSALHEVDNEYTTSLLEEEFDQGRIENFGRTTLYTYMRAKHGIVGR